MPLFWLSIHVPKESDDGDNDIIKCGINLFSFYENSSNHHTNDIIEYMWFDVAMPTLINITSIEPKTNLCMKLQLRNCIVSSPFHTTLQYQKLLLVPNSYVDCSHDDYYHENMTTRSMNTNQIRYFEWTPTSGNDMSISHTNKFDTTYKSNKNVDFIDSYSMFVLCLLISIFLRIFTRLWIRASSKPFVFHPTSNQQFLYTDSSVFEVKKCLFLLLTNGSPDEIFLEKLAELPGNKYNNSFNNSNYLFNFEHTILVDSSDDDASWSNFFDKIYTSESPSTLE